MKPKRIPCPHCGEQILPEAKKCRFCKERLDANTKSPSFKVLYLVWLLSMVIFFASLFFMSRADISSGAWAVVLSLLGLNVIGGIVAYLMLIIRVLNSIKTQRARVYGIASLVTFFAFFALLFNYSTIEAKLGLKPAEKQQLAPATLSSPRPLLSPTPTPTNKPVQQRVTTPQTNTSNKITCTGPDGKTFQTTQEECDAFNKAWGNVPPPNPNEYIRCNISPNCGGGYKEMTRASCDRVVCCQVNNSWELRDKDQCNTEQKQEADSAWIQFCNNLYNPDSCSTYWESGTSGWYDCRSDAFNGRSECYNRR